MHKPIKCFEAAISLDLPGRCYLAILASEHPPQSSGEQWRGTQLRLVSLPCVEGEPAHARSAGLPWAFRDLLQTDVPTD